MRILIDTNVLSEIRQSKPNPKVIRRFEELVPGTAHISAITIGEIVYGINRLPAGVKRRGLTAWLAALEQNYDGRVLPVDVETSRIWGEISAACSARGYPVPAADGLIAATALRHGMHLMTRNTKDFVNIGVLLINPWEE